MSLSPLQLLNSPALTATKSPSSNAEGGNAIGGTASSGAFNFGGASLTMPLMVMAGLVAVVFLLKKR